MAARTRPATPHTGSADSAAASPAARPRVLVGIHGGGFNGIDTYAEQVAVAAAAAGLDVTLLATSAKVASDLRGRLAGEPVAVIDVGLEEPSKNTVLAERVWPALMTYRLSSAIRRALGHREGMFDAIHMNRAALGPAVRPFGRRLYVAGWFYPHAPARRVLETWRHTKGNVARRLVMASKSVGFYLGDEAGYRVCDGVVACTEMLAKQLREQGLAAAACPPPVRVLGASATPRRRDPSRIELLVCSGDLSHPRKNLGHAVEALRYLVKPGREVVLYAIGRTPELLEQAAKGLPAGARLELLGPKQPREVHAKMREVDAFLFPSLFEEWGYVAVESLLSGTPVVAYPVYPFSDMLADKLGVVAERMTPESFAQAIERALAGECRPDLAAVASERFGAAAVGRRLARVWSGDLS